ncbi:MAG: putative Antifreeze glycopeptide polyprotein [Rhodospirillales bacterium]|nr:putative Antifreeze glycopeptide polyprotein [Rhodospirillales bacterium]
MTASRNNLRPQPVLRFLTRLAGAGLCVGMGAFLPVDGALAQQRGPQSLAPRTLEAPAVQQTSPQAPAANEPAVPSAGTGSVLPLGVESAPLAAIDPESIGPLNREQGGFDFDMWSGTRRGLVETMLPQMPARTVSPTLRNLMHRLLLTNAQAPGGQAQKNLVVLRAAQLAAMGDGPGLESLLRTAPARGTDPALLRIEADMLFLDNDNSRVCALVASQSGTSPDAYWRKADIFCQALAGEQARAWLGSDMLREQGDKDALFVDLLDALTNGAKPKVDSMAKAQPLHFAMARAAKIALPADVAKSDQPGILRLIATTPTLPAEQRLEAAERAEAMGVLETKVLRDIYASMAFSKEQLDKALSTAQSEKNAMSRALLYVRASRETVPTALAQIIQQALILARDSGRYQTQARVYRDLIAGLPPSRDLLWLAPEAARALLATGPANGANAWFDILRASAVLDDQSARMRDRLLPLARLAGAVKDADWSPDAVGNWYTAASAVEGANPPDADDVRAQAIMLFNLLEATGDTVPDAQWEKTVSGGSTVVPNAALWRQLQSASVAGRVGETIMLSTVALGAGPIGEADPTVLRFVVESLRGVYLDYEARALAIEAAVSAGI